jgi:hypothetical protein
LLLSVAGRALQHAPAQGVMCLNNFRALILSALFAGCLVGCSSIKLRQGVYYQCGSSFTGQSLSITSDEAIFERHGDDGPWETSYFGTYMISNNEIEMLVNRSTHKSGSKTLETSEIVPNVKVTWSLYKKQGIYLLRASNRDHVPNNMRPSPALFLNVRPSDLRWKCREVESLRLAGLYGQEVR